MASSVHLGCVELGASVPGLGTQRLSRLQVQPRKVQKWTNSVAATCQCCAQGKGVRRRPERRRCCTRHAQFAVTMEIYTDVSSEATRAGLKRLGESLEG